VRSTFVPTSCVIIVFARIGSTRLHFQ